MKTRLHTTKKKRTNKNSIGDLDIVISRRL